MKPAIISFCLVVSLAGGTLAPAQPVPVPTAADDAVTEGVRRQEATIRMRNSLAAAKEAQQKGYHFEATKLYVDCLDLIKKFGLSADIETKQVVSGLIASRLQLAQNAQRIGNLTEADLQVTGVLKLDPKNEAALKFKKENDKMLEVQVGRVPNQEGLDKLPETEKQRIDRGTQMQNAKLMYEAGNIDEAEKIVKEVFRQDPEDRAAYTYMMLIKERRYQEEISKRDLSSREAMLDVARDWNPPVKRDYLPHPSPYARTNLIFTGKGRQAILGKLERTHLNDVSYDDLPLSEVIKSLNEEARKRDPEKKGINFIMNGNIDPPAGGGGVDPATGLPIAAVAENVDLGTIKVKISPPVSDLSLAEVLDVIVKVADKPIKYSVEDYGIIISARTREAEPLYPRRFKVDPNTFRQGLQSVVGLSFGTTGGGQGGGGGGGFGGGGGRGGGGNRGGGGGGGNFGGGNQGNNQGGNGNNSGGSEYVGVSLAGQRGGQNRQAAGGQPGQAGRGAAGAGAGGANNGGGITYLTVEQDTSLIGDMVRSFFQAAGVTLDPPKILFYNDRTGLLWVKATLSDLDTVEQAIQILNVAPQQITIKAKFAEVSQDDSKALGFDWFWGNTLMKEGAIGAQGGTAPSFGGPQSSSPANPSGIFPGPSGVFGLGAIPPSATDNILTSGLRNQNSSASIPAVATITGILTDPQFRVVVRALEQRGGVDLLSAPEVTTLSSRQTQIKVVDVRYIVTDLDLSQTASGGGGNGNNNNTGGGGAVGSTIQAIAEPIELGPVLDVVPYVASDGYTIQMVIIPTLKEFLGYDLETGRIFASSAQSVGAVAATSTPIITPLPQFRLRQVATSAVVWDGQTVVLGGLISENVQKTKDKVPVLGDLPLFGRFFRSESNVTKKKNLLIFVSPTIIDPAGNRMHSEEEMPFAQQTIPPQKPVAQ